MNETQIAELERELDYADELEAFRRDTHERQFTYVEKKNLALKEKLEKINKTEHVLRLQLQSANKRRRAGGRSAKEREKAREGQTNCRA